ncbi:MAG: hypothetical protein D6782_01880, partial [Alphaproteobacteria bacterium]
MRLKQFVLTPLRWLDALLSDHVGPVRILFVVSNRIGLAHQMPLIQALAALPGMRVAVAVDHRAPIGHDAVVRQLEGVSVQFVAAGWAAWRKWHFVFFTEMMRLHLRRWATLFLLHHGPCWGNFDCAQTYGDDVKFGEYSDYLIFKHDAALSQATSHDALAAFYRRNPALKESSQHRSIVMGVPKLDHYRAPPLHERNSRLAALGLDPDRPTVLITSHWSDKGVLPALGFDVIETLLSHPLRLNIVILGHELIWRRGEDGRDARAARLRQQIESAARERPHVHFDPASIDNAGYLGLADLFLCDKSSIFVECLLFDKPILLFKHPDFRFSDAKVGEAYISASSVFSQPYDIKDLVDTALQQPLAQASRRQQSLDFL